MMYQIPVLESKVFCIKCKKEMRREEAFFKCTCGRVVYRGDRIR